MPDLPLLDLVIKNVGVVRPNRPTVDRLDLGVKDGRYARIAPEIPAGEAKEVYDARHLLGFPGVVDAHTHVGIYSPPAESPSELATPSPRRATRRSRGSR